MSKRTVLLLAACMLCADAAAADADFSGWHVGLHAGHGSGESHAQVSLGGQWGSEPQTLRDHVSSSWSTKLDPDGSVYGVQFGYDHQFANGTVLGIELDYSQLGMDDARNTGPTPVPAFPSLSYDFGNRIELDNQASLRARLGHAFGRHLLYLAAGWTQVDVDAAASVVSNGGYRKLGVYSDRVDGTQWGLGYECDFGNRWSLRAEYLVNDMDDFRYDTVYQPGSTFVSPAYTESVRHDLDFNVFRIGVNYRF